METKEIKDSELEEQEQRFNNITNIKILRKEINRDLTRLSQKSAKLTELINETWNTQATSETEQMSKSWEITQDDYKITTTITIKNKLKKIEKL